MTDEQMILYKAVIKWAFFPTDDHSFRQIPIPIAQEERQKRNKCFKCELMLEGFFPCDLDVRVR